VQFQLGLQELHLNHLALRKLSTDQALPARLATQGFVSRDEVLNADISGHQGLFVFGLGFKPVTSES
jgi:hypothetical protein